MQHRKQSSQLTRKILNMKAEVLTYVGNSSSWSLPQNSGQVRLWTTIFKLISMSIVTNQTYIQCYKISQPHIEKPLKQFLLQKSHTISLKHKHQPTHLQLKNEWTLTFHCDSYTDGCTIQHKNAQIGKEWLISCRRVSTEQSTNNVMSAGWWIYGCNRLFSSRASHMICYMPLTAGWKQEANPMTNFAVRRVVYGLLCIVWYGEAGKRLSLMLSAHN